MGTGVITTSSGNWNVGDGGYGIYVQQVIKEEEKQISLLQILQL